jgi:hypothetical protein
MHKQIHRSPFAIAAAVVGILGAGALIAVPAAIRAADSGSSDMYVCRQAMSGETATAKMMSSSTTLVCRPVSLTLKMSSGTMRTIGRVGSKPWGPDLSKALTPQQMNDAYVKFIEQTFHIDHTS